MFPRTEPSKLTLTAKARYAPPAADLRASSLARDQAQHGVHMDAPDYLPRGSTCCYHGISGYYFVTSLTARAGA